jgi:serine/threonine protein kinase
MAGEVDKPGTPAAETIFIAVLELLPTERPAYLDAACGDNPKLRQRVEALLRAHEAPEGFLPEDPGVPPPSAQSPSHAGFLAAQLSEKQGDIIGHYKLLEKIGEGGCGVVYMAEQEEPVRRKVALKVIKLGMDTKSVIARFEAERQALALMDHSNIAKVLDAGATDTGRPYFVMELVGGIKLTEYCDRNRLGMRQRLDLFIQVCRAIQHAHQKGIIHRDIKPSNVLVAEQDGIPIPKVIDFGIAKATEGKLTDDTVFTAFEHFLGTPAYMSPEQAQLGGLDVDTRSDIYSLGVLLYELLTGKTPFDTKELLAVGLDAMRRTICEKEPPTPSTRLSQELESTKPESRTQKAEIATRELVKLVRGDLDWIVMKCLEKDRARRYETANGLATDIARHLNNEPVVASPPGNIYRLQKLIHRNQMVFAAAGAVALALVLGLGLSTWLFFRERAARREQTRLRQQAQNEKAAAQTAAVKSEQVAEFLKDMLQGVGPSTARGRDTAMLHEILDKTATRIGRDLTNQPDVELELCSMLADTYWDLGLYRQSEEIAQQCLRLARTNGGEESEAFADALDMLGKAREYLGHLSEAEDIDRRALALRRKLLGDEHLAVARSLNALAQVLLLQGKLAEAEPLFREALAKRRRLLGDDHSETAASLGNLSAVLQQEGRFAEAEPLRRAALATHRRTLGEKHPNVAKSLGALGQILLAVGKPAEAEAALREGLALARGLYGNEHRDVALSLNSLAQALDAQGKKEEAEKLLRESLEMSRKLFGEEHAEVARALDGLAIVLCKEDKMEEAESLSREALALRRKLWANPHPDVAYSLNNLGSILVPRGKLDEAVALFHESLPIFEETLGPRHLQVAATYGNLAATLRRQGKFPEAEAALREVVAIQKASSPEGHAEPEWLDNLAAALREQNKLSEAENVLREALGIVRPPNAEPSRETEPFGLISHHLAEVLLLEKAFPEARSLAQESVEAYRHHPEWPAHERRHALQVLVSVLRAVGDSSGLEALHDQQPDVVVLDSLGCLLRDQGKLAKAETRLREGLALERTMREDPAQETSDFGLISHHLAEVLRLEKALPESRSLAQESVAAYRRHPGWPSVEGRHALQVLESVLNDLGDSAGLELFYREQLSNLRAQLPPEDPSITSAMAQLTFALLTERKFGEAETLARECLKIREKQAPDEWPTFNTHCMLGASLLGQEKYDKAEPWLLSGYEGLKQREETIPAVARLRLREAMEHLARLYEATERPEQASLWKQRLAAFDEGQKGKP